MPPHHLIVYHALSDTQTLVYHFERIADRQGIDNAARVVSIDRINDRTITQAQDRLLLRMDKSIQTSPLDEDARKKILGWCMKACPRGDISDAAYFPHVQGPPEKALMTYAATLAQFYFMNEFLESTVGSQLTAGLVAPERKVMAVAIPRIGPTRKE